MTELFEGVVTKLVGGVFTVETDNAKFTCFSPKKLRYNQFDVFVGDRVKFFDLHKGKGNITEILPRRNMLNRPEVANVDVCLIVVASEPQPDFYLVDKVLINCFHENIEPVIVVNKTDIDNGTLEEVNRNYQTVCDIVALSAFDVQSVALLKKYINENIVCFAGQSAVGKTSILNAILPSFQGKTGGISEKSGRGMHTTRHSSLHKVWNGYVVDTCGFSLCNIVDVHSSELRLYLDDFVRISAECRFTSCTHTVEPDCAVKKSVEVGKICKQRYERYLEEYKELIEFEKNKY